MRIECAVIVAHMIVMIIVLTLMFIVVIFMIFAFVIIIGPVTCTVWDSFI